MHELWLILPFCTSGVPEPERVHVLEPAPNVWFIAIVRTEDTVMPPEPVAVVVVAPVPSPKVRLEKAHFNSTQNAVTYANIRDGGCDTGTSNVTLDGTSVPVSNNDTCWVFGATYTGIVYTDEGTTVMASGPTVQIKINGAGSYSAVA